MRRLGEHLTRLDANVCGIAGPHLPLLPEIIGIKAAALNKRLGKADGHLRVVGELGGLPAEATPATHLTDAPDDRHWIR